MKRIVLLSVIVLCLFQSCSVNPIDRMLTQAEKDVNHTGSQYMQRLQETLRELLEKLRTSEVQENEEMIRKYKDFFLRNFILKQKFSVEDWKAQMNVTEFKYRDRSSTELIRDSAAREIAIKEVTLYETANGIFKSSVFISVYLYYLTGDECFADFVNKADRNSDNILLDYNRLIEQRSMERFLREKYQVHIDF